MKTTIKILFSVLFSVLFAACGTTRKIANETSQQQITSSVNTDTQKQSSTSDVANVTTSETDYSKAVIEFKKIEYSDGTTDITTDADVPCDTVKQREREQTEPPNAQRYIKSVTTGRITIDNDKQKQTIVNEEKTEDTQTQTKISEQSSEDTQTKLKTEDKPTRGFFFWFGVITCIIIAIVALFFLIRAIEKHRRWNSD